MKCNRGEIPRGVKAVFEESFPVEVTFQLVLQGELSQQRRQG